MNRAGITKRIPDKRKIRIRSRGNDDGAEVKRTVPGNQEARTVVKGGSEVW